MVNRLGSFFAAWVLALSAFSFGFAQEEQDTETQTGGSENADEYLVWLADEKGRVTTYWLSTAKGSTPITQAKAGMFIIQGAWLHALEYKERHFFCCDCSSAKQWPDDKNSVCPPQEEQATNLYLQLRSLLDGQTRTVVAPLSEEEKVNLWYFKGELHFRGAAGGYLFLTSSQDIAYCQAFHPNMTWRMIVWDAKADAAVTLPMLIDDSQIIKEAAERAFRDLQVNEWITATKAEELELVAIYPHYDASRNLRLTLQFITETCYTDSDYLWSTYTRSALVDIEAPISFRGRQAPPDAVVHFLNIHGREQLLGWMPVTLDEAAALECRKAFVKAEARDMIYSPMLPAQQP